MRRDTLAPPRRLTPQAAIAEPLARPDAPDDDKGEAARYRTGAPGRPGSKHIVLKEFMRRAKRGDAEETIAAESHVLSDWLREKHPLAHPITPRTVENAIRVEYRRFWSKPRKTR